MANRASALNANVLELIDDCKKVADKIVESWEDFDKTENAPVAEIRIKKAAKHIGEMNAIGRFMKVYRANCYHHQSEFA